MIITTLYYFNIQFISNSISIIEMVVIRVICASKLRCISDIRSNVWYFLHKLKATKQISLYNVLAKQYNHIPYIWHCSQGQYVLAFDSSLIYTVHKYISVQYLNEKVRVTRHEILVVILMTSIFYIVLKFTFSHFCSNFPIPYTWLYI